jgi:two-component system response regulator YesN
LVVVDDDAAIVRIVERMLAQRLPGLYDIVTFTDPRAARQWLDGRTCDVLVSDVEMPGIGGLELLRTAKGQNPLVQTIFLTAHSSWDRIAEAIESGVNDYLLKPVDHDELIGSLRQKHERIMRRSPAICELLNGVAEHPMPVPVG